MKLSKRKVYLSIVLLTLFIFGFLMFQVRVNFREAAIVANTFAIESSFEIRETIARTSMCPTELDGWEIDENYRLKQLTIWKGSENEKFPIRFKCNEDLSFEINVLYAFDSGVYYATNPTGEVNVAYGHFTDQKYLSINKESDIKKVAQLVY